MLITPGMRAGLCRALCAAVVIGWAGFGVGCKKEAAPPVPPPPPPAAPQAPAPVPPPAPAPVPPPPAPAAVIPAPTNPPAAAAPAAPTEPKPAAADEAKAQAIIDAAKKLVAEQKWQEVAPTLLKLQGMQLTPAQEKSLIEMKDQLEKMIREALGK